MPKPPFSKVLIANRGEIAARLIRSARSLGMETVSVHSSVDAGSLHTRLSTESILLGDASSTASYLRGDRIISAALSTKARAIHPGYGFLSERADFAESVSTAGLVFIGPSANAMRLLGDKVSAKQLAVSAGVNVIPGHAGTVDNVQSALNAAKHVGYPVMLKAAAGGGGKGMRIAFDDAELSRAFTLCSAEAKMSFGDARLLLERFVEKPRHVEVQILGDLHGNVIALGERDCSIQRRSQKVIEESPAPKLDVEMRREMHRQAVALARAAEYSSAGTVECLVDEKRREFYFLEMNTRLQVEHPVTEMIWKVNIPELMYRIAGGEALPKQLLQMDTSMAPAEAAFEARVYAENPFRNFMPASGVVRGLSLPAHGVPDCDHISETAETKVHEMMKKKELFKGARKLGLGSNGVRIDSGIEDGMRVHTYYDALLAKVITWGETRDVALKRLGAALDEIYIGNVENNVPFLKELCGNARFASFTNVHTAFVQEEYPPPLGFTGVTLSDPHIVNATAIVASAAAQRHARATAYYENETATATNGNKEHEGNFTYNIQARYVRGCTPQAHTEERAFVEGMASVSTGRKGVHVRVNLDVTDTVPADSIDTTAKNRNISDEVQMAAQRWSPLPGCGAVLHEDTNTDSNASAVAVRIGHAPHDGIGVWRLWYKGSVIEFCVLASENARMRKICRNAIATRADVHAEEGRVIAPMPGTVVEICVSKGDALQKGDVVMVLEAMKMRNEIVADVNGIVQDVLCETNDRVAVDQTLLLVQCDASLHKEINAQSEKR